jgi:hypothetical protein
MSIYNRDSVSPEWEPMPWDAQGPQVDEQERGFHERACKPLAWSKIDWRAFPAAGVFGQGVEWFREHDIEYVTTFDGEEMVLIRNTWSGFPDPPEWGLASRRAGRADARWEMWGCFPALPNAWTVPEAD